MAHPSGPLATQGRRRRRRTRAWPILALLAMIVSAVAVYGTVTEGCVSNSSLVRSTPADDLPPPDVLLRFAGAAGSRPDPGVWGYDTGGSGWGNDELQNYTDLAANSAVDGSGSLVITARRQQTTQPSGKVLAYTSARLTTQGRFEVQPGSYIEAVINPPVAEGVWPAFWLLGRSLPDVGWPASGELDVMEVFGNSSALGQYLHVSTLADTKLDKPFGGRPDGGPVLSTSGAAHRFGVYFDDSEVRFYIDRQQTVRFTAEDARHSDRAWPFGQPFFLLVNVAIGGRSGDPAETDFPRRMVVEPISIWDGGPPFERPRC